MRLLLIHRYLWPDAPPYGHMLLRIARRFIQRGHSVRVLSTQPSYNERTSSLRRPGRELVDGVELWRMGLIAEKKTQAARRLFNTALFLARVAGHLLIHRYDLVTFSTMPPVMLGVTVRLALRLTGRRGRYLYHCQDLYPEVALYSGMLRDGPPYRVLRTLDTSVCKGAAAVVVLSRDMKRTLAARGVPEDRVHVINNLSLVEPDSSGSAPAADLSKEAGSRWVVFAGNLGRFQGLETVIDAARLLSAEPQIRFIFLGEGVVKEPLKRRAGDLLGRSVHFRGYLPPERAFEVLRQADLGLVTLRPALFRAAFPSKLMTYLMAGCRVLAVVERESELAETILTEELGAWCPQDDPAALAELIRSELARPQGTPSELMARARVLFGEERILGQWMELLDQLGERLSRPRPSSSTC